MIKEVLYTIENKNLFTEGKNDTGKCFVNAYDYMSANSSSKINLVHGLVVGQGPIEGVLYNHAWIEKGNEVIDTALKAQGAKRYKFPKDLYYAVGQINPKTVFKYTFKEMIENVLETEVYGPWAKILKNNKL